MNVDPEGVAHIECRLDGDPRLIAGAAIIVVHVARRAGLADQAASEIAAATSQTCSAVLQVLQEADSSRPVRLAADEFPDRIEVTVESVADGPSARKLSDQQSRRLADQVRQLAKSVADGATVELHEGFPRVILVKKSGAAKRPFAV